MLSDYDRAMSITQNARLEIALAAVATIVGIVMTSWAVLAHVALLVAPGALLITIGGAWWGNALARHGIRLVGAAQSSSTEAES